MARILVIDDDTDTLKTTAQLLKLSGFHVAVASTVRDGVAQALAAEPDLILTDLRLPDGSGIELIRSVRGAHYAGPVVVISGFANTDSVVAAMQAGATDFVDKPVFDRELIALVKRNLDARAARTSVIFPLHPQRHALARWAKAVVGAVDAPSDPKTLRIWARHVGASVGAIRNWCRTARLSPKRTLYFTRVLRAVLCQPQYDMAPEDLLDVADRRTLTLLLRLGTKRRAAGSLPTSVDEFLQSQGWIDDPAALDEVRLMLGMEQQARTPRQSVVAALQAKITA